MTITEAESLRLALERALRANRLVSWTIGEIGSAMRKQGKAFLKLQDSPSWRSFCGEIGLPYSTFSNYIRLYDVYGPNGVDIGQERFTEIGPRKLLDMLTVIDNDTEEWLARAETLSESDLRIELGREPNKKSMGEDSEEALGDTPPVPFTPNKYKAFVKGHDSCIICHAKDRDVEHCHWPRTRKHGEFALPLCRRCHGDMDTFSIDGVFVGRGAWFDRNFVQIGRYLDTLIGG